MDIKQYLRPLCIGGCIGIGAALLYLSGGLASWSSFASDRFFLAQKPDPSIVIVAIDDASISQLGRWPWDRRIHAEIVSKLTAAGVRAIGYDVNFPEAASIEQDMALEDAIRSAGNVVLPIELTLEQRGRQLRYDPTHVVSTISQISGVAQSTGHSNAPPDRDGIVRQIPLFATAPDQTTVPAFAAQVLRGVYPNYAFAMVPLDAYGRVRIHFSGPPAKTFPIISAVNLVHGDVDAATLKNKIVFVGATAADLHDDRLVPTSAGMPMAGVEIHASLYDTLLRQQWLRMVPGWVFTVCLLFLGFWVAGLIVFVRARYSTPLILVTWAAVLVGAFVSFDRGWLVDVIWPTITLFATGIVVTLERRIAADLERRKLRSAFSRYVSSPVVESILRDPSKLKLGGEKRNMSVLFSDVRGFTSIAETMSPEQLVEVMNTYLTKMTDIVFANEGVLDKYIGDAVMAFWNAPFDQSDHALRAVKTALVMQQVLAHMNQEGVFLNGLQLRIGVGINTGEMIVGNMGSETRFDYTVIGDNVNLASRIEGITKEYGVGVLIAEATRVAAGESVLARRVDKVAVKGKKEPVVLYEAMALLSEATNDQKQLVTDFESALEAYFSRQFTDAVQHCQALLQRYPDDGPSALLLTRAEQFLIQPPPEQWDGTWVYTKK